MCSMCFTIAMLIFEANKFTVKSGCEHDDCDRDGKIVSEDEYFIS